MVKNTNPKNLTTVLFLWKVNPRLKQFLKKGLEGQAVKLIFPRKTEEENLLKHASKADVMVGWRPTSKLLDQALNLTLFINPGAGVQHLLTLFRALFREKPKQRKPVLVNGHGNAILTAEHIMAMLLGVCNKIVPHHNWMQEGKWRMGDKQAKSLSLKGQKIGLLGYGKINQAVHRFLKPYQCDISVLKKHFTKDKKDCCFFTPKQLHPFLKQVDILIIAIPLTSETEGMIGEKELQLLGKNGILINAGRGPIVNEKAFYQALKNKTIAYAGIDVWYNYKPKPNKKGEKFPYKFPFHKLDNVLLSPHRAASPMDNLERWDEVVYNIIMLASGKKKFVNVVDLERGY